MIIYYWEVIKELQEEIWSLDGDKPELLFFDHNATTVENIFNGVSRNWSSFF